MVNSPSVWICGLDKMSSFSFQPITLPFHNRLKNTTPFSTESPTKPNTSGFISRRLRQSRPHVSTNTSVTISRRDALMASITLLSSLQLLPTSPPAEVAEKQTDTCQLTVSPSGLEYCDRVVGTGSAAMKGQLIKAHYTGKLENGNVFDSSYPRGRPLTFRVGVGEVIKGWDLGILGGDGVPPMLAGGKRTLKLPPELGYGARGAGCKGGKDIMNYLNKNDLLDPESEEDMERMDVSEDLAIKDNANQDPNLGGRQLRPKKDRLPNKFADFTLT